MSKSLRVGIDGDTCEPSDAEVEAFREAWVLADGEGDAGNRVRRGLIAAHDVRAVES